MGIDETGVVIDASETRAWVRLEPGGDCSACASSSACRREADASGRRVVEAINPLGVRTGQRVVLHMEGTGIVKASLLMYALPLLLLLLGAFLGKTLGGGENPSDTRAALFGLGFMVAGFLGIRLWGQRAAGQEEFYPRITRILE